MKLASGEGDLDDLVTLGITGAGLGAGGLPPGKKVDLSGGVGFIDNGLTRVDNFG